VAAAALKKKRHIPEKYLVHILLQLKRAGLVRSVRGAQGGYLLAKPSEQITLLDLVQAIEGPILDPLPVGDAASAELKPAWLDVAQGIERVLAETTLRQIMEKASASHMYYI